MRHAPESLFTHFSSGIVFKWMWFFISQILRCNYGAEMTLLNVGRFAGLGVGYVPKCPNIGSVSASRNATQVLQRDDLLSLRLRANLTYQHLRKL